MHRAFDGTFGSPIQLSADYTDFAERRRITIGPFFKSASSAKSADQLLLDIAQVAEMASDTVALPHYTLNLIFRISPSWMT